MVFDELIAVIGWDPILRLQHQEHIAFLQHLMERVETYRASQKALLEKEHEEKAREARLQREAALKRQEAAKQKLRAKYKLIPSQILDLALAGEPDEEILELLQTVYTGKPQSERQNWANLLLTGKHLGKAALSRLIGSAVLSFPQCRTMATTYASQSSASAIAECETALQLRGNGEGHIPDAIAADDVIAFILASDVTSTQLTWLFHAPGRDAKALVQTIKFRSLSADDVKRIGACPHVPLDICGARIVDLRSLSIGLVGILDDALVMFTANGGHLAGGVITQMAELLNGANGMTEAQKATYTSGCLLYENLAHDTIKNIVLNNGDRTDETLRVFNAKIAGCLVALTWGVRNDTSHAIYAPLSAGTWDFFHEIIDDMFNWRGRGASHSFTFAQILYARDRATSALGGTAIPDANENVEVPLADSRRVSIILNRNQRRIVTMYTI